MRVLVRAKTDPVRCNCGEDHRLEVRENSETRALAFDGLILEPGERKMLYYCPKANILFVR